MSIKIEEFGKTADNKTVDLITLTNKNNLSASFSSLGGTWVRMIVPDRDGNFSDVVLGYDTVAGYEKNDPHFGAMIGRYANRIAGGKFSIDKKNYQLEINNDTNSLHSGIHYWHKRIWKYGFFEDEDADMVTFMLESPDGDQGFPGEARISVSYILANDNSLTISYNFVADKNTPCNLTNHAYFNLAGHDANDIYMQEIYIDADTFLPSDLHSIPTGEIRSVDGTPMDFRKYRPIGKGIDASYDAIIQGNGYDHNWIVNGYDGELRLIAKARDTKSGRVMEVYTDLPGVQFYTGNFILGEHGKSGITYEKRGGYCFETQFYPNAINMPQFPSPIAHALEEVLTETKYIFLVD